jgi:HlyD family secretion protein
MMNSGGQLQIDPVDEARALSGSLAADLSRMGRYGLLGLAVFVALFCLWTAVAPLSHAVTATGSFVVETRLRNVQHPTGGRVTEVLATEGERVEGGAVIVRLDDRTQQASHLALQYQRAALEGRLSRLEAERDGHAQPRPMLRATLTDDVWPAIASAEQALFAARREARDAQARQLQLRIEQAHDEIEGLDVQFRNKQRESEFIATELSGLADLARRRLVPLARLTALQRTSVAMDGEIQGLEAQIAQVHARIAELRLQVSQVSEKSHSEASDQLRDVQARLAETIERLRTSEQQLERMAIRAPVSGVIHSLTAAQPGANVVAGASVFEIVPDEDTLHIDVTIRADDYAVVRLGQKTLVRLHAFNTRTTPELAGLVTRMDPNSRRDQATGANVFTIRVSVGPEQRARLGTLKLRAGMTADVVITTAPSSPFDRLATPLGDLVARAFRER